MLFSTSKQPPSTSKGSKMMSLINYRLRITLNDGRQMTGQMLAFDQHMNLVMAESECADRDVPFRSLILALLTLFLQYLNAKQLKNFDV